MTYTPPIRDIQFTLEHVAGAGALRTLFDGYDAETESAVLEAAGKLARDVLAPLNREGDQNGARIENGKVFSAPGFAEAYKVFAEGGWNGLSAQTDFGGQGLPKALEIAAFEMFNAANMAFSLCPILTLAGIEALTAHGTASQQRLYLPKLVSGEWTGTMNLTEPQSGSDLSGLRMRAERGGDGSYRISGQKIFITWGDHDCTENIVHLLLARLPDAPPGTKGISLFLAPKRLVDADGKPGQANGMRAASLEHKLGIHASPTCVMLYENAYAELVGEENRGLAHMFTMMNAARLQIGVQGVGIAEGAYQKALGYALERRQGRSPWTRDNPARLFDLPDIRRTLMLMKAKIEAARAICLSTAVAADLARHAPDEAARKKAQLREELFTPIAKAWSTDKGVEIASDGLQVHGGMGFIEETGAAQFYRDARIAPIYEGTNAIQAIDLAGRKLGLDGGEAVRDLFKDIAVTVGELRSNSDKRLSSLAAHLETALLAARDATEFLDRHSSDPDLFAGATAYLALLGDTVGGWMLAKGALAALRMPHDQDSRVRPALAYVYGESVLSRAPGHLAAVRLGADALSPVTPDMLGAS